jgi:hypothetical protein
MFQGDVGKVQMDKSQVVADFLFPTDKKTLRAVRPRVAAFDYPATGSLAGTTFDLHLALARNVQNVSQTPRKRLRELGTISFVQAKMLLASSDRLGPPQVDLNTFGLPKETRWVGRLEYGVLCTYHMIINA